jgi:hypothetical protein
MICIFWFPSVKCNIGCISFFGFQEPCHYNNKKTGLKKLSPVLFIYMNINNFTLAYKSLSMLLFC